MSGTAAKALYTRRAKHFDREATGHGRVVRRCGRLRLAAFALVVTGVWLLWTGRTSGGGALAGIATLAFVVFVARQRAARVRERRAQLKADFNRRGTARIERRWCCLPEPGGPESPKDHNYAHDLDLGGHASLWHLIGICGTEPGRETLLAWLLSGASPATVANRQGAVAELAAAHDFRDALAAEALLLNAADGRQPPAAARPRPAGSAAAFLRWAESKPWLAGRPWIRVAAWVLPSLNLLALVLIALGVVPAPALAWSLLVSGTVLFSVRKAVSAAFSQADDGESRIRLYGPGLRPAVPFHL